ncbi:MAG: hypothetical protein A2X24_09025 [Chloroflexi bacterium GWB2_54_36]|nr:MAG: hypothetical protein A2X24_09025 [Chloroflexi bacterium GWB2_54_36]
MIKRTLLVLIIVAALLTGCSAAKTTDSRESGGFEAPNLGAPEPMPAADYAIEPSQPILQEEKIQNLTERMVIRNASLSIVVVDPAAVMDDIMAMANGMGGYVVDSNLYQTTTSAGIEVPEARVTVRVPADQLDAALTQIKAHVEDPVNDILFENISGQDVTQEYTDLQSRLRNLEDAAEQLREILDNAIRTEDVLTVFNELKNVNEQIEVLKGQIQYYEQSSRLSAISVTIQAKEGVQPINIGGWEPQGVARDALQSLVRAYQWLADVAIWLVVFCLPIAIPVGLVVFFVVRGIRKWNRGRKAIKAVLPEVKSGE